MVAERGIGGGCPWRRDELMLVDAIPTSGIVRARERRVREALEDCLVESILGALVEGGEGALPRIVSSGFPNLKESESSSDGRNNGVVCFDLWDDFEFVRLMELEVVADAFRDTEAEGILPWEVDDWLKVLIASNRLDFGVAAAD